MIKANMRRRVVSVLLALVMLVSLMPSLVLPAHAFWDDYDDGFDCPNCDHYHFGSDYMCDCLFCTIDCNYECWVETHCNDCGVCFGDTPYWCEECYKCAECMEEKHCSTCAKCYIGEDDQLCGECHKGPCCSITICDSCGFCDDCANEDSDPMHCSLCNACFGSVDECVDDDDTGVIHCVDCHTACEQCEECLLAKESCEDCGLCKECCRDNSDAGGCPDGETCVESAEWEEHICPGCDGWVTDKEDEDEFCETCELCKECCEGNSDCSEGMCAMDTDYADHFCEDCGLCFCDSDPCEDGCDQRCKDCCLDAVKAMGCDHDDWCFSDSDFEDHLKAEHSGAGHTHIASSSWSADGTRHWHPCRYCDGKKLNAANHEYDAKGVCKVCGYISGSSIVITRQPKGVKCKTSIYDDYNEEPENGLLFYENNQVTFSVAARSLKGDELTYQWYRKDNEHPTAAPYKLPEGRFYMGVTTSTLKMSVSTQACQEDYSYYCVIGRKGDASDTMKTAEAKLTATHAYSYKQAGEPVYTDDGKRTPEYKVTWVDKDGNTHNTTVGSVRKSDGHKLACLFEAGAEEYEAHYMTSGSKERIFPHTFKLEKSYDAVGGGRVDMLVCTVCDYFVFVKSHVHDYGWNWDYTGFGSIYEYTFNIGGSTKTVEQLILESGYAHPEKCKVPGCEEFIMVPHSWGRWNVVLCPDTAGAEGGMEAECSVCEYKETEKIDGDWTKDTALVTVKNGRATRMIVKPGDKIRLYPEERNGQKAIGWKVEYLREYNDGSPVKKNWSSTEVASLFKLVNNGSALEWGCTIPAFSAMGAPGGGQFFFEPVYAGCDHSGGTTVLNAKAQVCDRKGYTGDTACADCGQVISAGSDIYPPANAGHTGPLQPLYYYGTNPSATTDPSHGGKRYNANSGDCRHRAYEGDYRCTACGGTVKGETGDFKHSGPFELRDVRAATCTEKGYSGNQYCTACDRISKKGSATPSLHEIAGNYKLVNEVKPGCTTTGYSGDYQCTRGCGQIFRYGHVIDKLSHDWDGGKPATQGKSDGILYTCRRTDCGETKFVKNPAATEYAVTVTGGTASASGNAITSAAAGVEITVTAIIPDGKVFDKWVVKSGGVTLADAASAVTTFTMPANDVALAASYKDAPVATYSLTTQVNGGHGTISASKTGLAVGSTETIIFTPDAGYEIDTVTVNGAATPVLANVLDITMDADKTVIVTYKAIGSTHTHSYGTDWKYDGDNHWHECECGDKADIAAHSASEWIVDTAATETADGAKHKECTVCKMVLETETIPATGSAHTHSYGTDWKYDGTNHWHECECGDKADTAAHSFQWVIDKAATKEATGIKHEECTVCGAKRSENTEIPALRDYAVTVTGGTATVAAGTPITRAMEGVEVTVTAQAPDGKHFVKWVVKAGGITLANETSATTTFTMPANDVTIEAEFAENPVEAYTLTVIKGTASVAAGTPITDKIEQNTVVTVTADAPEAGKVFDKWVVLEGNVTLADATKATTTFTMPGNDVKIEATYKDAPPSHTHSYGTEWKYDDTNHWHECECGDKADIAAHSASEWIVDTAATETADGAKHKECTVCKMVLETETIPATGSAHTHSYGTDWKYDGTNHWHECECGDKADTAAHSFQWVIDKTATKEATGIKHEECTVCGAKRSENTVIDKLPDGGNTGNTGSGDNNTDKPGKDDSTKPPQTGDSRNLIGWLAALFVCGGVLTVLGLNSKKRKESEAE